MLYSSLNSACSFMVRKTISDAQSMRHPTTISYHCCLLRTKYAFCNYLLQLTDFLFQVPQLTEERRKDLAKQAKVISEVRHSHTHTICTHTHTHIYTYPHTHAHFHISQRISIRMFTHENMLQNKTAGRLVFL